MSPRRKSSAVSGCLQGLRRVTDGGSPPVASSPGRPRVRATGACRATAKRREIVERFTLKRRAASAPLFFPEGGGHHADNFGTLILSKLGRPSAAAALFAGNRYTRARAFPNHRGFKLGELPNMCISMRPAGEVVSTASACRRVKLRQTSTGVGSGRCDYRDPMNEPRAWHVCNSSPQSLNEEPADPMNEPRAWHVCNRARSVAVS